MQLPWRDIHIAPGKKGVEQVSRIPVPRCIAQITAQRGDFAAPLQLLTVNLMSCREGMENALELAGEGLRGCGGGAGERNAR